MVTKQLSIAIAVVVSFSVGLGIARTDLRTFAAAPASATTINFDQVFADATRQSTGYVDRAHKGDRLPMVKTVLVEPILPNCEPVASPYSDPVLSRIVGRCDA
jgi:hypothetical protein